MAGRQRAVSWNAISRVAVTLDPGRAEKRPLWDRVLDGVATFSIVGLLYELSTDGRKGRLEIDLVGSSAYERTAFLAEGNWTGVLTQSEQAAITQVLNRAPHSTALRGRFDDEARAVPFLEALADCTDEVGVRRLLASSEFST